MIWRDEVIQQAVITYTAKIFCGGLVACFVDINRLNAQMI
jgi:hypothetical protein